LSPGWRALDRDGDRAKGPGGAEGDDLSGTISPWTRVAALASLVLWLTAILLGRLVGYF
jgi:hypothetical protein